VKTDTGEMRAAPEARDHAGSFAANQRLWEAWTAVHAQGEFYDLDGFRAGGVRPRDEEIAAVGDDWSADLLVESEPGSGRFVLPPGTGELPLSFSLRATKPATG
jgi:hypothetical protein